MRSGIYTVVIDRQGKASAESSSKGLQLFTAYDKLFLNGWHGTFGCERIILVVVSLTVELDAGTAGREIAHRKVCIWDRCVGGVAAFSIILNVSYIITPTFFSSIVGGEGKR